MILSLKIWILLISIIQWIHCAENGFRDSGDDRLIFAHTLCRHGDRNIAYIIPNDPWKDESNWKGGYGHLTSVGKRQHYDLGKYFRKRYASFIGNGGDGGEHFPDIIYVQSSSVDRVILSAKSNLAGLLSVNSYQIENDSQNTKNSDIKLVPVHTIPYNDDNILAEVKQCDHFDYAMLQYMNGSEYTGVFKKYASFIKHLEAKAGLELATINDIYRLYDVLFIEKLKNKRLPKWAEEVIVPGGDLERIAFYCYRMYTVTEEMKQSRSGHLLKEILDRFTDKTMSTLTPDRSLWMYFGHDCTLADMLNSLGVFDLRIPPYASCILFELYQGRTDPPYVQIFYKNSIDTNIPPLNIPNCGSKCPLHKLYDLYKNILPTQSFDDACALRDGESLPPGGNPENNWTYYHR